MKNFQVCDWGLLDYKIAHCKQKELHRFRVDDLIPDTLIFVEHPTTFTIGKHGKINNLLVDKKVLAENNIELYHIERGGDITLHNPGQLVGYVIFKLSEHKIGIKNFVYLIEKIIIEAVAKYQIVAEVKHPLVGVFVDNKKIASLGIAVSRGVSYHGFALNVNNDLSYFNWINPCGIKTLEMTSIKKILNYEVPLHELKRIIIERFIENFQLNLLNSEVI